MGKGEPFDVYGFTLWFYLRYYLRLRRSYHSCIVDESHRALRRSVEKEGDSYIQLGREIPSAARSMMSAANATAKGIYMDTWWKQCCGVGDMRQRVQIGAPRNK